MLLSLLLSNLKMDLVLRLLQDIFLIGVLFPIGVVVYSVFEVIVDYIKNW